MAHRNRIPDDVKVRAIKMAQEGHNPREISKACNISIMTARKYRDLAVGKITENSAGGKVASKIPAIELESKKKEPEKRESCVILKDKTIELVGTKTKFIYTTTLHGKELRITTGYSEDGAIDLKDVANLSNELIDVLETIMEMRKNMWRA